MKSYLFSLFFILSVIPNAYSQSKEADSTIEAVSFSGKYLYQIPVDSATLAKYTSLIVKYRGKENLTEEDFINWGNDYASIYQFQNAIKIYTEGLSHYPHSFKLLLYRAHRQLSIRKVDGAMADLEKALTLMNSANSGEMEYQPNGDPKGTFNYWIYYHHGLGNLLNGNYKGAISDFKNCLNTSVTANNKVGATYWLYISYLKAKSNQKAEKLINDFVFDKGSDMNYSYSRRVLLYQGKIAPEELLNMNKNGGAWWSDGEISAAYDVANWYKQHGENEKAMDIKQKMLKSPKWNVWAYLINEKDLISK